jgi:hypothetical protein
MIQRMKDIIKKRRLTHFEVIGEGNILDNKNVAVFNMDGDIIEIHNISIIVLTTINKHLQETKGCIERV